MTSTRQQLIEYCLRKLGEPVVEINVDDQQVEDRVFFNMSIVEEET
jgi:hypothetical protein